MTPEHSNDLGTLCIQCTECQNFGAKAVTEKVLGWLERGREHGGEAGDPDLERVARAIIRLRILAGAQQ
jgi:hypothetical protein